MERQVYQVGATVIEARELTVKDEGTSDPFVKILCAKALPQQTGKVSQMNSVVWNKTFSFTNLNLNRYELESFELIFEVYDHNEWANHALIGIHKIGLSTLYRQPNNQITDKWLPLTDPKDPLNIQGFLKVTVRIVGRYEQLRCDQGLSDEEDQDQENKDLNLINQGLKVVSLPRMNLRYYQLTVKFYKGEDMPASPSNDRYTCPIFFSVDCQNLVKRTATFARTKVENNMGFMTRVMFPVILPSYNDKIKIAMWSEEKGQQLLLANLPEFPTASDMFNISRLMLYDGTCAPFWMSLYSVGLADRKNLMKGQLPENSAYMGRVLISLHLQKNNQPQYGCKQIVSGGNDPDDTNYLLKFDFFEFVPTEKKKQRIQFKVQIGGSKDCEEEYETDRDAVLVDNREAVLDDGSYKWKMPNSKKFGSFGRCIKAKLVDNELPDIMVSYKVKGERMGYLRLPATDYIKAERESMMPEFKWHNVHQVTSKYQSSGMLLASFQLIRNPTETIQHPSQPKGKNKLYNFYSQIISGFGLAPQMPEDGLRTRVEIDLSARDKVKNLTTKFENGRFPLYKYFQHRKCELGANLQFAADLSVSLIAETEGTFTKGEVTIGKFLVPISSLKTVYPRPQFFNIINEEGFMLGKILARFYIAEANSHNVNQDKRDIKLWSNKLLKLYARPVHTADVNISVIGVRSLQSNTKQARLKVSLTDHMGTKRAMKHDTREGTMRMDLEEDQIESKEERDTFNPNFLQRIELKNVELSEDPMLWPLVKFEVQDSQAEEKRFIRGQQCETCFAIVPLIQFQPDVKDPVENISFTLGLMQRGQTSVEMLIQNQTIKVGDIEEKQCVFSLRQPVRDPIELFAETIWATKMILFARKEKGSSSLYPKSIKQTQKKSTKDEDYDPIAEIMDQITDKLDLSLLKQLIRSKMKCIKCDKMDAHSDEKKPIQQTSLAKPEFKEREEELGRKSHLVQVKAAEQEDDNESMYSDDSSEGNNYARFKMDEKLIQSPTNLLTKTPHDNIHEEDSDFDLEMDMHQTNNNNQAEEDNITLLAKEEILAGTFRIDKNASHCESESKKLHQQRKLYGRMVRQVGMIKKKLNKRGHKVSIDLKEQIIEKERLLLSDLLNLTDTELMTSELFLEADQFSRDRTELFQAREEEGWVKEKPRLNNQSLEVGEPFSLPFEDFPLLEEKPSYWESSTFIKGVHFAGKLTGGYIRAVVSVVNFSTQKHARPDDDFSSDTQSHIDCQSHTSEESSDEQKETEMDDDDDKTKLDRLCKRILRKYPFDLAGNHDLLRGSMKDVMKHDYKILVYILACHNLTAVDSVVSLKEQWAGNVAMCSADPFIIVRLGMKHQEFTTENQNGLNIVSNRDEALENDLNPIFYRQFELEATFPEETRLEISIWDKGTRPGTDTEIGRTEIDLEMRRLGSVVNQAQLVLDFEEKKLSNNRDLPIRNKQQNKMESQLLTFKTDLEELVRRTKPSSPIEFRPLLTQEGQTQGMIEMWCDVLTKEELRNRRPPKLNLQPARKGYEVRLIIWETCDVPLAGGESVNIQIVARYYRDQNDEVTESRTDVHANNKTGKGKFNWRMKFQIEMPANYPRIMMQLMNSGLGISEDETIGEINLNLKDSITLLVQEGELPENKIWIPFNKPNCPDVSVGFVLVTMQIIGADEAVSCPVGEGQEAPNENPYLRAPKEGRSYSDQMATLATGIALPELPSLDYMRKFFILAIIIIVLVAVGIVLNFFK